MHQTEQDLTFLTRLAYAFGLLAFKTIVRVPNSLDGSASFFPHP